VRKKFTDRTAVVKSGTEESQTHGPDWFAPLRWPGWLGSLSTFIEGI
jgi:hypothetical protein